MSKISKRKEIQFVVDRMRAFFYGGSEWNHGNVASKEVVLKWAGEIEVCLKRKAPTDAQAGGNDAPEET